MCKLRIRDLREDHDLNQSQTAQILHTSQRVYSRYETGERTLPLQHLIILSDYYNVSTDYILGKTNDPTPPKEKKEEPPKKEYSSAVIKAAEEIRANFKKRKGREPNQEDLRKIVKFINAFIQSTDD